MQVDDTLGTILRRHRDAKGDKGAALAEEWRVRYFKGGGCDYSSSTVPPRLSGLFSDAVKSVRFFFTDTLASTLLFDLLEVPENGREELRMMAEAILAGEGQRPARLVIEISAWEGDSNFHDQMFLAIEQKLVQEHQLRPAVLILSDQQYRRLPRTFDDLGDDFRVERLQGREVSDVLAKVMTDRTVLASPSIGAVPFHRWLALHFDGNVLMTEPTGGVAALVAGTALPQLPEVPEGHKLIDLTPGLLADGTPFTGDACQQHRLMLELTSGDSAATLENSPSQRLLWAQSFGTEAVSSLEERIEVDINRAAADLGIAVETQDEKGLEAELAKAGLRPVSNLAMRVGNTIHVINPTGPVPTSPRIDVHVIATQPPALTRILEHVEHWTEDDYLDDRGLDGVIQDLDPEGLERDAFLHARAWLLFSEALAPKPIVGEPCWQEALAAILGEEVPQASLRCRLRPAVERSTFLMDKSEFDQETAKDNLLHCFPRQGEPVLNRVQALCTVINKELHSSYDRNWPNCLSAKNPTEATLPDAWLNAFERSRTANLSNRTYSELFWSESRLTIPAEDWLMADQQLALLWLALRANLSAQAVREHSGTVLLPIADGVAVRLLVRHHGEIDGAVQGSLLWHVPNRHSEYADDHFMKTLPIAFGTSRGSQVGCRLPLGITLKGKGYAVDVTFLASPLISRFHHAPMVEMARHAVSLEHRRRLADDDD